MRIIDLSKTVSYQKQDPWFMRIRLRNYPHRKSLFLIRYVLRLELVGPYGIVNTGEAMKMG